MRRREPIIVIRVNRDLGATAVEDFGVANQMLVAVGATSQTATASTALVTTRTGTRLVTVAAVVTSRIT